MPDVRSSTFGTHHSERVAAMWRAASAQPGWLGRAVLMTFILVIAIPIFLLVMLALIVASVVFAVLFCVNYVFMKARGILPKRDGRENVRVIQRRNP